MIYVVVNGKGHFCISTVDRAGRCIYKMFDLMMSASFKNIYETYNIAIDVRIRVGDGVPDACLGSEVDDGVKGGRGHGV